MLDRVKTKLKKNTLQKSHQNEFKLTPISNNFFPYSCLVDDSVILTKNGEIFQTVEIKITDFTKNKDNGVRDAIRKAISSDTITSNTSFWIHTVKKKKDNISQKVKNNITSKNFFLQRINDVINNIKDNLNQYDIITYITIVQGDNNNNSSLLQTFKKTFNFMNNSFSMQERITSLKKDVERIFDKIKDYNPRILGIRIDSNEVKYSEMMEFLYFIVNHKQKEIAIEQIDITDKINESNYLFENGKMLFQNNHSCDVNVASAFSIKEVQNFNISIVADIINNMNAEMIISEYIDSVDKKTANGILNEKNKLTMKNENILGNINQEKYYQSSTSIFVFDDINDKHNNSDVFLNSANTFAKNGIVIVREDIGLERSYYAMMPANFYFTYRLSIHDENEIGSFIYSYVFQDTNSDIFVKNLPLLNIGTLKNNPVQIGFLKENSNILISGPEKCGKGVITNLLASAWENAFDSNIIYVELNKESSMFIDAIGGKNYCISADQMKNNAKFNLLNFKAFDDKTDIEVYLSNMLSLMMSVDGTLIDADFTNKVNLTLNLILQHCDEHKRISSSLSAMHPYFKDNNVDELLRHWYLIGKYYHLFDNKNDVFDDINIAHFHIDTTISSKSTLLSIVVHHLFTRIVNFAKHSNKPTIVVVDEPFILFSDVSFAKLLDDMENISQKTDTHFIFKIQDFEREMMSSVDFNKIIETCGLQIHFANKDVINNNYMRIFQLNKTDYTTINALSKLDGMNFFVKYLDDTFCCQLNIKDKKVLLILSDPDSYAYNNIMNIKNHSMNYDPNSYIARYFSIKNI